MFSLSMTEAGAKFKEAIRTIIARDWYPTPYQPLDSLRLQPIPTPIPLKSKKSSVPTPDSSLNTESYNQLNLANYQPSSEFAPLSKYIDNFTPSQIGKSPHAVKHWLYKYPGPTSFRGSLSIHLQNTPISPSHLHSTYSATDTTVVHHSQVIHNLAIQAHYIWVNEVYIVVFVHDSGSSIDGIFNNTIVQNSTKTANFRLPNQYLLGIPLLYSLLVYLCSFCGGLNNVEEKRLNQKYLEIYSGLEILMNGGIVHEALIASCFDDFTNEIPPSKITNQQFSFRFYIANLEKTYFKFQQEHSNIILDDFDEYEESESDSGSDENDFLEEEEEEEEEDSLANAPQASESSLASNLAGSKMKKKSTFRFSFRNSFRSKKPLPKPQIEEDQPSKPEIDSSLSKDDNKSIFESDSKDLFPRAPTHDFHLNARVVRTQAQNITQAYTASLLSTFLGGNTSYDQKSLLSGASTAYLSSSGFLNDGILKEFSIVSNMSTDFDFLIRPQLAQTAVKAYNFVRDRMLKIGTLSLQQERFNPQDSDSLEEFNFDEYNNQEKQKVSQKIRDQKQILSDLLPPPPPARSKISKKKIKPPVLFNYQPVPIIPFSSWNVGSTVETFRRRSIHKSIPPPKYAKYVATLLTNAWKETHTPSPQFHVPLSIQNTIQEVSARESGAQALSELHRHQQAMKKLAPEKMLRVPTRRLSLGSVDSNESLTSIGSTGSLATIASIRTSLTSATMQTLIAAPGASQGAPLFGQSSLAHRRIVPGQITAPISLPSGPKSSEQQIGQLLGMSGDQKLPSYLADPKDVSGGDAFGISIQLDSETKSEIQTVQSSREKSTPVITQVAGGVDSNVVSQPSVPNTLGTARTVLNNSPIQTSSKTPITTKIPSPTPSRSKSPFVPTFKPQVEPYFLQFHVSEVYSPTPEPHVVCRFQIAPNRPINQKVEFKFMLKIPFVPKNIHYHPEFTFKEPDSNSEFSHSLSFQPPSGWAQNPKPLLFASFKHTGPPLFHLKQRILPRNANSAICSFALVTNPSCIEAEITPEFRIALPTGFTYTACNFKPSVDDISEHHQGSILVLTPQNPIGFEKGFAQKQQIQILLEFKPGTPFPESLPVQIGYTGKKLITKARLALDIDFNPPPIISYKSFCKSINL